MSNSHVTIDRQATAQRIEHDIETLGTPPYTMTDDAICRYAYTTEYTNTLEYFRTEFEQIGFDVQLDPIGNLVARNVDAGSPSFGLGSHCDSNRRGGKYDGSLGVVTALEICRLNAELELGLPLTVIAFLEEEASGFGYGLLGSRIITQQLSEQEMRQEIRSLDDGRSLWEHAEEAGLQPERWREAIGVLDGMFGWLELHIEQARVLQDRDVRIGIVTAIAGIIQADLTAHGRADHAGGTPMDDRRDPALIVGGAVVEMERLATAAGPGTVGTIGELELLPGIVGVIAGTARASIDVRSISETDLDGVVASLVAHAKEAGASRELDVHYSSRLRRPPTPMAPTILAELENAAQSAQEPYLLMHSGAAHDTMLIAPHVPAAMVFVPCLDGISHSPVEYSDPAHAALATEIMLNAIVSVCNEKQGARA